MNYKPIEKREMDPLKAVHEIQTELFGIRRVIDALQVVGLRVAEDLQFSVDAIEDLATIAADGICRETNEAFKNSQQATTNMIRGALAGIEITKEA